MEIIEANVNVYHLEVIVNVYCIEIIEAIVKLKTIVNVCITETAEVVETIETKQRAGARQVAPEGLESTPRLARSCSSPQWGSEGAEP